MKNRILFYASVDDPALFDVMLFYRTDLRILAELGYRVVPTNRYATFLKFWSYDVAFIWFWTRGLVPALVARIFGKRVIFTGGFDDLDPESSLRHRITKLVYLACVRLSHANIVISPNEVQNFERHGYRMTNGFVVPCVVDFDRYAYDGRPKKNLMMTVCWMGTEVNAVRKGVDRTIKVLAELLHLQPDFRLIVVCTAGPGLDLVRDLASSLGVADRVVFAVGIPEEEKVRYLQESRFYLQLSTYESFGLAAVEAMASGNLVVHSGKGALAFTVGDAHGLEVVDASDAHAIAMRLNDLLARSGDHALVEAAMRRARTEFGFDVRKSGLQRVLETIQAAA